MPIIPGQYYRIRTFFAGFHSRLSVCRIDSIHAHTRVVNFTCVDTGDTSQREIETFYGLRPFSDAELLARRLQGGRL